MAENNIDLGMNKSGDPAAGYIPAQPHPIIDY